MAAVVSPGVGGAVGAAPPKAKRQRKEVSLTDALQGRLGVPPGGKFPTKSKLWALVTRHLGADALPRNSKAPGRAVAESTASIHDVVAVAEAWILLEVAPAGSGVSAPSGDAVLPASVAGDTAGAVGVAGVSHLTIRVRMGSAAAPSVMGGAPGESAAAGAGAGLERAPPELTPVQRSLQLCGARSLARVLSNDGQTVTRRKTPPTPGNSRARDEAKGLAWRLSAEEAHWMDNGQVVAAVAWRRPRETTEAAFEEDITRSLRAVSRGRQQLMATQVAQSTLLRRTSTPAEFAELVAKEVSAGFRDGFSPRSFAALSSHIADSAIPAARRAKAKNAKVASGEVSVFNECTTKPGGRMWAMLFSQIQASGDAKRKMGAGGEVEAAVVSAAARTAAMTTHSKYVADMMRPASTVTEIARALCRTVRQVRVYFAG
jgi:hypothetical protein